MKHNLARIVSVTALGAVLAGCAVVPGDPYYESSSYPVYRQPDVIYGAPQVYSSPPVYRVPPVIYPYAAPPAAIYDGGRDRDRNDWRERERDRDRADRDRHAHERERERRDQQARDANQQRARERDQARREHAAQADREQGRRAAEARRPRNDRDRRQDDGGTMPGPNDWRARQQSNSFDKP